MDEAKNRNLLRGVGFLALGFLCLVVIGLVVGITITKINEKTGSSDEEEINAEEYALKEEEELKAQYVSTEEYIEEMRKKIEKAETKEEEAQLYMERAEELYGRQASEEGDYKKQILADAYKAEELAPSAETAFFISVVESDFGNEEKAAKYEELAGKRGGESEEGNG